MFRLVKFNFFIMTLAIAGFIGPQAVAQQASDLLLPEENMIMPETVLVSIVATPGQIVIDLDTLAKSLVNFDTLPSGETENATLNSVFRLWKEQAELVQIEAVAECTLKPGSALIALEQPRKNTRSTLARIEAEAVYKCNKLEADREITLSFHRKIPAVKKIIVTLKDLAGKTTVRTIEKPDFFVL